MNRVILIGRVSNEISLRYTQSGTAVASFTLAVNRRFANQNGEREADFINCQAWQKTAEFVANYFKKGQMMALEGRLQVSSYEKDGQKYWKTEVVAEQVEFCGPKEGGNNTSGNADTGFGLGVEVPFNDDDLPF